MKWRLKTFKMKRMNEGFHLLFFVMLLHMSNTNIESQSTTTSMPPTTTRQKLLVFHNFLGLEYICWETCFSCQLYFLKFFPLQNVNFEISDQEGRSLFYNSTNILYTTIPNKDNSRTSTRYSHQKPASTTKSIPQVSVYNNNNNNNSQCDPAYARSGEIRK